MGEFINFAEIGGFINFAETGRIYKCCGNRRFIGLNSARKGRRNF